MMDGMDYMCWFENGDQQVVSKRYKTVHGGWAANPRLYGIWRGMLARCRNPRASKYAEYGGIGIDVCDEWASGPLPFIRWALTHGYGSGLSLDRIDNAEGYTPNNCRWATSAQQCRNRGSNIFLAYKGKTQCLTDWAAEYGLPRQTLRQRVQAMGWDLERALSTPVGGGEHHRHKWPSPSVECEGETRSLAEWAAIAGVTTATIRARKRKGQPLGVPSQKPWLNTETALRAVGNRKPRNADGSG